VRKVDDTPGYAYTATVAPSAGALKYKQTCPDAPGVTYSYDATGEKIDIYDSISKVGTTYTRKLFTP
jgi:hypothetical protein